MALIVLPLNPTLLKITDDAKCSIDYFMSPFITDNQVMVGLNHYDDELETAHFLRFYDEHGQDLQLGNQVLDRFELVCRPLSDDFSTYEIATMNEAMLADWWEESEVPEPQDTEEDDSLSRLAVAMTAKAQRREGRHAHIRC